MTEINSYEDIEIDTLWTEEFEKTEKFYKEKNNKIKIENIFLNKEKEIEYINNLCIDICDNILKNDVIMENIQRNTKKYKLITIFKYNNITDHNEIHTLKYNEPIKPSKIEEINYNQDVFLKDTIKVFQSLNTIYCIYIERTNIKNNNNTKKIYINNTTGKTRKKRN